MNMMQNTCRCYEDTVVLWQASNERDSDTWHGLGFLNRRREGTLTEKKRSSINLALRGPNRTASAKDNVPVEKEGIDRFYTVKMERRDPALM